MSYFAVSCTLLFSLEGSITDASCTSTPLRQAPFTSSRSAQHHFAQQHAFYRTFAALGGLHKACMTTH
jgi:hypothetical protein